jgi:hypothetical protein
MYYDLILYTEPKRPIIQPKFDLFAWLNRIDEPNLIFPARIYDKIPVMLPEKAKIEPVSDDIWKFIVWQSEEKGYTLNKTIDDNWWYWSLLVE